MRRSKLWALLPLGVVVILLVVARLAPSGAWRCATSATYTYDPRHERADAAVVTQPPEALTPSDAIAVRVEVDLRGGDATLWAIAPDAAPDTRPTRVIVLSPGALQSIGPTCYVHLGHWKVVADHALQ